MVDFKDTPIEAVFRAEVRAFIAGNLPPRPDPFAAPQELDAWAAQWEKAVGRRGWIAPHWPTEYGGAGMTPGEQFIFNEEIADARAPVVGGMGVSHIGPILVVHGTEEQRQEHLPRITSGEIRWAQGYSEPGAGSDLAGLQTRAVRDGDDFVINGQKIWSSGAHKANWMFVLARTDPDAPKHRGISMFLLDLKTPGITMQPIINMSGDHHFNQEYFDNVRVPARNLVGELNRGWYIGASILDLERSMIGPVVEQRHEFEDLVRFLRETAKSRAFPLRLTDGLRAELADRAVETELNRILAYRVMSMQKRGVIPNYESSMNRLFLTESQQRLSRTAMKIIDLYGQLYLGEERAPLRGRFPFRYLRSTAATVAGGTAEIQRNVIANRGLGLPRG